MNKKGATVFVLLMLGVLAFLLGLALTPAVIDTADEAMETPELDCSNSSISDQNKAVCDSVDIQKFLFIGTMFGLAAMLLGGAFL